MGQHGKHRALVRRAGALAAIALAALLAAGPATAVCRQALALGLDVSGSVDPDEYWLQRNGLAAALVAPEVIEAFLALPEAPVSVMVFEWSGFYYQKTLVSWTPILNAGDLERVAADMLAVPRRRGENATGIGAAVLYAGQAFRDVPLCWKKTLDLSGDGKNNDGPGPEMLTEDAGAQGFTINALVIGGDPRQHGDQRQIHVAELVAYFQRNVIRGPGAFTEVAVGFSDFEEAMTRKLLRELDVPAFSSLEPGSTSPPKRP